MQLLERTARTLHSRGYTEKLYPAQWAALRYFSAAPDDRKTATALARFQGLATGPVTRTVRTLIAKGLLVRAGSGGRGRAQKIELAKAGWTLLERDPFADLARAFDKMPTQQQNALATVLEETLEVMQLPR
jgi:DNA-binding MarR family transcriptional regulator